MTSMIVRFDGADYRLTDDAASCSYGEPVLIGPDGTQYRAGDVVLRTEPDAIGVFVIPAEDLTALDIAHRGEHFAAEGEAFRALFTDRWGEVEGLTDYGHATADMFGRFSRQRA